MGEPRPTTAPELPYAGALAVAAGGFFSGARVLVGPEASLDDVLPCLGRHRMYHFSCHGSADPRDPLSTSLLLAGDTPLTVRTLVGRGADGDAPVRLAVLAACESGVVGERLPDELVALPTALLECNVAGVVASHWTVLADSTVMLVLAFYDLWRLEDARPAEALQLAQQWLRDTSNAQKAEYFAEMTAAAGSTPLAELAAALHATAAFAEPEERRHADAEHWAAFGLVGV